MGLDINLAPRGYAQDSERITREWDTWADGQPHPIEQVHRLPEEDSVFDPNHLFKTTYLRSSYNEAGFNNRVPQMLRDPNTTLYDIFAPVLPDGGQTYLIVVTDADAVRECQRRARSIADRLGPMDSPLLATTVLNIGTVPMKGAEAITWVSEQLDKEARFAFTSREGFFDPKGLTIHGLTFDHRGHAVLVYRDTEDNATWYRNAALITAEFCQVMIDHIETDGEICLLWSA